MFARPRRLRPGFPRVLRVARLVGLLAAASLIAGCAGTAPTTSRAPAAATGSGSAEASASSGAGAVASSAAGGTIQLYTSVTQDTVDAVVRGLASVAPRIKVNVFRAPTGQLNARIAADERSGGLKADVVWLTDPLSMQPLEKQGRLLAWTPAQWSGLPDTYRTAATFGTRFLNMVIVARQDVAPMPASWQDLADPAYRGGVAIPDPGFAGSAFGVLGYFGGAEGYGLDYYRRLRANGAVQLQAVSDVVTGVAQGRYKAGMTLDNTARAAIAKGSPITMVWPSPGAIAVVSPIGVAATAANAAGAKAFVEFVLSLAGQKAIGDTGWQPIRPDAGGPHPGGPQVQPDWAAAAGQQEQLLKAYRAIFGG